MSINAFFVVFVLVLIGCTVLGGVKGFVHTVFSMCSLFIVIIVTGLLSPYVSDYIKNHTEIPVQIYSKVEKKLDLESKIESGTAAYREKLIETIDIPDQLKDVIKEKGKQAGDRDEATKDDEIPKLVGGIYDRITDLIVSAIAYLFTFAVVGVIVIIAGLLLDIMAKLPGIRQANAVLGAIIGFGLGYLVVSVLYIAATAFAATELGSSVIGMVEENSILSWFYNNNPVINIVFGMLK